VSRDDSGSDAEPVTDWRGIANEDAEVTGAGNTVLARRSRVLLGELVRPYRWRVAIALVLVVIENAAMVAGPLFVAHGLDRGIEAGGHGSWSTLAWVVGGYAACALAGGTATYCFYRHVGRLSQDVLFDLRVRAFAHAQRLDVAFHERYTSGKVVTRLTSDIEALQELLESSMNLALGAILSVVTIACLLVYLDPPLAVIVFIGFVPLALVTRWAQRRQRAGYRRTRTAAARVVVHFVESMGGMRAVQAFRRERRNDAVLAAEDDEFRDANVVALRGMAAYSGLTRLLGNLTTVVVIVVGAWRVIHGDLAVGVLAAYLLYLNNFYKPLDDLAQVFNAYQSAAAALEKISGVLEERPAVTEPDAPVPLGAVEGRLRLERVWFDYGRAAGPRRAVLPEFDLDIPAGQVLAVVGATGAGKSTLVKLLTRFYDPSGGRVTLDGVDLRHIADADLRRAVVMVTQEAYLFAGSVADNIRIGRPEATDAEVRAAARAVGLDTFVAALPQGYDTDVRRRGGRLSAGQRQLVAFARVFLADPAVIVLDEATSSLDIPGERLVQQALETLLRGRTAIIIAHRLSTVAIADRVLVMAGGRIVEDGAPEALAAGSGRFAGLHTAWRESLV